jgi:S1-C subfamily serine protease
MRRLELILLVFVAVFTAVNAWPGTTPAESAAVCGWIGVRVHPMTPDFAASLGMAEPYGAIFGQPRPGGPAAQAHIEAYDVVTTINGSPLHSWRDFAPTIAAFAPNTTIYLTTWRSRQLIDRRVVLGRTSCPPPKQPH